MTHRELAQQIGVSYPRINELVHGKRGVTPETALRLAQLFGVGPQFWLNPQMGWDLYQASHSPSARAIRRTRRLPALRRTKRHAKAATPNPNGGT